MRIAVATDDGRTLAEHFGRSAAFLIFDVEDGEIRGRETRPNAARRLEGPSDCGAGGHSPHNHADLVSTLSDCVAVVCGGMGRRAAEALAGAGIAAVVTAPPRSADEAVRAYARGELRIEGDALCHCSH